VFISDKSILVQYSLYTNNSIINIIQIHFITLMVNAVKLKVIMPISASRMLVNVASPNVNCHPPVHIDPGCFSPLFSLSIDETHVKLSVEFDTCRILLSSLHPSKGVLGLLSWRSRDASYRVVLGPHVPSMVTLPNLHMTPKVVLCAQTQLFVHQMAHIAVRRLTVTHACDSSVCIRRTLILRRRCSCMLMSLAAPCLRTDLTSPLPVPRHCIVYSGAMSDKLSLVILLSSHWPVARSARWELAIGFGGVLFTCTSASAVVNVCQIERQTTFTSDKQQASKNLATVGYIKG